MNAELAKIGAHLDALFYCPHHPQGNIPLYTKTCSCRKPETGMVDEACRQFQIDRSQSFFVGDSDGDMECAKRANLTGIRYTSGSLLGRLEEFL